ncbi:5-oxoprolinase subunit PxpB [Rufibacter psychrotolerans]|uniref:5-oxoprolinase subunit PxpB n=1 Tax=Rufibacter psychrotolerans TaxID=2812556 RepID=UPI0019677DF5|nr:5-oxoprolinase subunit PxpB [Rufibacter sp. SYSU D00308]
MANPAASLPQKIKYQLYPLGEAALVVQLGDTISPETFRRVQACARRLAQRPFPGFLELVPAYTTVTVYFNPLQVSGHCHPTPYHRVARQVEELLQGMEPGAAPEATEAVMLPVCYGGVFGPDLEFVAQTNQLTPQEVIALHTQPEYVVYLIGFAPGFPYLGGMNQRIAAPRRATPRGAIPAGSVGIAGHQTGVYPLETPGGWQLIGRTPRALFRPDSSSPSLLKAGDTVRFYPISEQEFRHWQEGGTHEP